MALGLIVAHWPTLLYSDVNGRRVALLPEATPCARICLTLPSTRNLISTGAADRRPGLASDAACVMDSKWRGCVWAKPPLRGEQVCGSLLTAPCLQPKTMFQDHLKACRLRRMPAAGGGIGRSGFDALYLDPSASRKVPDPRILIDP
jgi:hypothetical protein